LETLCSLFFVKLVILDISGEIGNGNIILVFLGRDNWLTKKRLIKRLKGAPSWINNIRVG
jgi:hypothetical protein